MKIGLLSICTMMFMLYGTDCRAEKYNEDMDSLQEIKEESFKPVFAKNWKNARRNEQRKNRRHQTPENFVSDREEAPQINDSRREMDDFRDERSYADVVRGVKRQAEVNHEEFARPAQDEAFERRMSDAGIKRGSVKDLRRRFVEQEGREKLHNPEISKDFVNEKRHFFERNDDKKAEGDEREYNKRRRFSEEELDRVREKGFVRENRDRFEFAKEEKVGAPIDEAEVDVTKNISKKEKIIEKKRNKVAPPQTSHSKKAYKARKSRQGAANQGEFSRKWKSANKSNQYISK